MSAQGEKSQHRTWKMQSALPPGLFLHGLASHLRWHFSTMDTNKFDLQAGLLWKIILQPLIATNFFSRLALVSCWKSLTELMLGSMSWRLLRVETRFKIKIWQRLGSKSKYGKDQVQNLNTGKTRFTILTLSLRPGKQWCTYPNFFWDHVYVREAPIRKMPGLFGQIFKILINNLPK